MKYDQTHETILILDFGSQYTQLIARRVRDMGVFSEIQPFNFDPNIIHDKNIKGIILSGSPHSVYDSDAPIIDEELLKYGMPVLGICYGLQLIVHLKKGKIAGADHKEYGLAILRHESSSALLKDVPKSSKVWMSHGDKALKLPYGFEPIARTDNSPLAAFENVSDRIYGLQFHPEVVHSDYGERILHNFVFNICSCTGDWSPASFIEESIAQIRQQVGNDHVLCALSGGVDSSVVAVLLHQALGHQLHCIFIDTGLLRLEEARQVEKVFTENFDIKLTSINGSDTFYSKLQGVNDPEVKRKRIGNAFIYMFEREAKKMGHFKYLAQGTLYPDVIESVSFKGPSATIKSHHNVGGLPETFGFELIEPLRELFKDEVRKVGRALGIPDSIIDRHPFPGPGLAVRILGEVTQERVEKLQKADAIYIEELHKASIYDEIWQAFTVLLPVQTVGVMGDKRTYENVVALRAVTSIDGMTADWYHMSADILTKISNRIINEVRGINRVVYDISSKPPSTIEWE
ncbi:MAG: glutamine-hydrolyzing GMP synthase [Caldithrix sp.]|nr:glutamine-hydrolyzing GMP synthase [Caldithrix sp.]